MEINIDSTKAIDLLTRECQGDHPFRDLVEDARNLIMWDWEIAIRHIPKEANAHADHMARFRHTIQGNFLFLEESPDFLR